LQYYRAFDAPASIAHQKAKWRERLEKPVDRRGHWR
jgi:hypothetical protein